MIQLRDIHLSDGSAYSFTNYLERLDYAQLDVTDHFGVENFAFLTDSSDLVTVPASAIRVVRLDTRQRLQRITTKPVTVKVGGMDAFQKCQVIDKADWAFANVPRLFAPQLVWSCESGTYVANVAYVISIIDSDTVRTSKVVPRNALHVKNEG